MLRRAADRAAPRRRAPDVRDHTILAGRGARFEVVEYDGLVDRARGARRRVADPLRGLEAGSARGTAGERRRHKLNRSQTILKVTFILLRIAYTMAHGRPTPGPRRRDAACPRGGGNRSVPSGRRGFRTCARPPCARGSGACLRARRERGRGCDGGRARPPDHRMQRPGRARALRRQRGRSSRAARPCSAASHRYR